MDTNQLPSISLEKLPPESYLVRIHDSGGTLGDPYDRAFVVCRVPGTDIVEGKGLWKPKDDPKPILTFRQGRAILNTLCRKFTGAFRWDRRDNGECRRESCLDLTRAAEYLNKLEKTNE